MKIDVNELLILPKIIELNELLEVEIMYVNYFNLDRRKRWKPVDFDRRKYWRTSAEIGDDVKLVASKYAIKIVDSKTKQPLIRFKFSNAQRTQFDKPIDSITNIHEIKRILIGIELLQKGLNDVKSIKAHIAGNEER